MYIKMERQRETEEREYFKMKDQANKKWTSDNSKKIFEKLQLRKLKELFDQIDTDKDGEISENSFIKAELSKETLTVLRPLIKSGKRLDFNEFLEQL